MNTRTQKITIFDNVLPQTVTSSTDATPIVVTKAAHGYTTGDLIMIQGHTTNLKANGIFKIVVLTANTFSLYDPLTGLAVAGSGAGAGSGGIMAKLSTSQIALFADEFREFIFQLTTTLNATLTFKFAVSEGRPLAAAQTAAQDVPLFGAPITANNPYSMAQFAPENTNTAVAGDTGLALTGTDVNGQSYRLVINRAKYIMPLLTAWTAGRITLIAAMSNLQ